MEWGTIVAIVALVLSQLPPIREILKGTKIRLAVPERFTIYQFLSNININIPLFIQNIGGRNANIAKVDCVISDADRIRAWYLPAQTYYLRNQPSQEFLVGSILLKPNEQWSEVVHCFRTWSEADEETANEIISNIRGDIVSKLPLYPSPHPSAMVEAEEALVQEAREFFRKRFNLTKGNYQLFIAVLSETNQLLSIRGFDFTLFESHIRDLQSVVANGYQYGAGLYFPSELAKSVSVKLRPMPDEKAREVYKRMKPL